MNTIRSWSNLSRIEHKGIFQGEGAFFVDTVSNHLCQRTVWHFAPELLVDREKHDHASKPCYNLL